MKVLEVHNSFGGNNIIINIVWINSGNENILIDCGYPHSFEQLEKVVKENNLELSQITKIIITHHDFDHLGLLAELKDKFPKIEIISSVEEKQYILKNLNIAINCERNDEYGVIPGVKRFHKQLNDLNIAHSFNIYKDHYAEKVSPHLIGIVNQFLSSIEFCLKNI